MKVLIVEDSAAKASEISECVLSCHQEIDLIVVDNAHEAFEVIRAWAPRLVILDVMIPFPKDGNPTEEASIWLVREISRKIPRAELPMVVGATQFPDAKRKVEESFGLHLWNVVVVSESDPTWQKWITYAVNYQANAETPLVSGVPREKFDAAILTALRQPEYLAVMEAFGSGSRLLVKETFESWTACQITDTKGNLRRVIVACADDMGMSAMASLATRVILYCRPQVLLLAGIMGGNKQHVGLSDLVAIEETWDCRAGKLTEEGFAADVKSCKCSMALRNLARSLFDDKFFVEVLGGWKGDKKFIPKFHSGAVACSPAVLAHDTAFEDLSKQKRKVMGVEMEGFGCYYATEQLGEWAPRVLGLKAVCDLGDKAKNDELHRLAAYISAVSSRALLSQAELWNS